MPSSLGRASAASGPVVDQFWQQCPAVAELQRRIATASIPVAAMAYEPQTLVARFRDGAGAAAAAKLRKEGRTPAIVFSLPGNQSKLIDLEAREVAKQVKQHGRRGIVCRVYNVDMQDEEGQSVEQHRVLVRQVHVNAVSDMVENVTLLHCPPDRRVLVDIPIRVIGEEVSPGIRRGGNVNKVMRTVRCSCPGDAIPPHFVVNVSKLDLGDKVELAELHLPPHVSVAVKDAAHPVCKIGGKAKRET